MIKHSPGPWKIEGTTIDGFFTEVVDANDLLVLRACTTDPGHRYHEECQANLRLALHATQLLAVARELKEWGCVNGVNANCQAVCALVGSCPVVKVDTLLKEIDGKEEVTMAKRKSEFFWEGRHVLWCDKEHRGGIEAVGGVLAMTRLLGGHCYTMGFDPRYDEEEVKAEIEAIIMGGQHGGL